MVPPMLLYMRVGTIEKPGFGWWLPLFLVWILLLPLFVLALVITLLVDTVLFLVGHSYHHYTLLLAGCLGVLGATRGTTIRIHTKNDVVDIDLV